MAASKLTASYNLYLLLEDYVSSYKTSKRYRLLEEPGLDTDAWGISIHELIKRNSPQLSPGLIRSLHILWDHKKVLKYVFHFLTNTDDPPLGFVEMDNEYSKIENEALLLRNMGIKFKLTKKDEISYRMIDKIDQIKRIEIDLIKMLLGKLSSK